MQSGLVDRALKARWNEALERYRVARAEETAGWDERYEALGDIVDAKPPLYLAGGFKTAGAFLRAEAPELSERQVRTYIRVARYFDPEDEARHGVSKLEALLDYLEAAGGVPLAPAKLHVERQRVRVKRGKVERRVPFAEVTVQELRAAVKKARGGRSSRPEPPVRKTSGFDRPRGRRHPAASSFGSMRFFRVLHSASVDGIGSVREGT
jgi:hypothetical protein